MHRTDYAQVRQLAKDILVEYKQMALLSGDLQNKLKALEGTFLDDSIDQVKDYTTRLVSSLVSAQNSFFSIANELTEYARLLEAGKGNIGMHMAHSSLALSAPSKQSSDGDYGQSGNKQVNLSDPALTTVTNTDANTQFHRDCLGVMTRGAVPDGYLNVIDTRYQNGESATRRAFDHFVDQILIQNANYPVDQTAHYSPVDYAGHPRGVYYNAFSDMCNPRGAGTTYYHELAHMIDHAATGYQGNLSDTEEFRKALIDDGQRILSAYNGLSPEQKNAFMNRIRSDQAHSFSDLIDGITNGALHGSYGHSMQYWTRSGNLQAEAFAHFFEASMGGGEKLDLLANFFPTAYGVYSSMIDSIQPHQYTYTRVLRR